MLVRYYGHIGQPSGYGHAANETCMAILEAGFDLEIQTDGSELHRRYMPLASRVKAMHELTASPDVVIVHTLPLDCAKVLGRAGLPAVPADLRPLAPPGGPIPPGPQRIAYTTWEGHGFASWAVTAALAPFHDLWVPSHHNAEAFAYRGQGLPEPKIVPHAYDASQAYGRSQIPNDTYTFYYIGAWNVRKNVEGVIRAYLRAFEPKDDVRLVIQAAGASPDAHHVAMVATGLKLEEMPPVVFSCDRRSDAEIRAIHEIGDCFVTASRGEAWNLPAFDAMLHGAQVIAPQGQGSDDFLRQTSAIRYNSYPAPAGGEVRFSGPIDNGRAPAQYFGSQGLTVRQEWQEPDIGDLAVRMRRAFKDRMSMSTGYNPADRFSRQAVGARIKQLLQGDAK